MRRIRYLNILNKQMSFVASFLICIIPALISGLIAVLLRNTSPQKIDTVYSSKAFAAISSFLGNIFGVTKRSVASFILILLVILALGVIVSFAFIIFKSQYKLHIAKVYIKAIILFWVLKRLILRRKVPVFVFIFKTGIITY